MAVMYFFPDEWFILLFPVGSALLWFLLDRRHQFPDFKYPDAVGYFQPAA